MRTTSSFSDYQPLGHLGRLPIHVTTLLAIFYVIGMVFTTFLQAASNAPISGLSFVSHEFFGRGWLWEPFTCTFVNSPNFFFLFGIVFFYTAGIEVERFFGRKRFIKFFLLCLLVVPLTLSAWWLLGVDYAYSTVYDILVAMFIAFATLYPNIEYFGWVPLKYVAFACFAIACLQHVSQHDWVGFSVLAVESAAAFGVVRYLKNGGSIEFGDLKEKLFGPRRNFKVVPSPSREYGEDENDDVIEEIDPLLEKIAKSGLASLTRKERARLEKARQALIKKETPDL
ncbi:MAG: hypothetical protein JWL59_3922 [Chthoniobacteraceae bacterium]|nr:hypothetical protein [Chthoniobacteraceae bacterium]